MKLDLLEKLSLIAIAAVACTMLGAVVRAERATVHELEMRLVYMHPMPDFYLSVAAAHDEDEHTLDQQARAAK